MKKKSIYFFGLGLLFFLSCTESTDFNQFDDLNITPTLESSLVYIESTENLINLSSVDFYSENFVFDAFNEAFFSKRVIDGSITYEIENTTSKELRLTLQFVNAEGIVLDEEVFNVPSAPTAILSRDTFYGAAGKSLDILINTTEFRVSAENLGDDISESSLANPKIIFKSSGEFRIKVK